MNMKFWNLEFLYCNLESFPCFGAIDKLILWIWKVYDDCKNHDENEKKKRYCGAVTKFSNNVISDFLMNFRQIQNFEVKQNYKK